MGLVGIACKLQGRFVAIDVSAVQDEEMGIGGLFKEAPEDLFAFIQGPFDIMPVGNRLFELGDAPAADFSSESFLLCLWSVQTSGDPPPLSLSS
jgi:hypothetical protein